MAPHLDLARRVASQLEACRAAAPLSAIASLPLDTFSEVVDPGLAVAVLAGVEERLAGAAGLPLLVLSLLSLGDLSSASLLTVAARLAASGRLSEDERSFVANVLRGGTRSLGPDRAPELTAAFGPVPALVDDLAAALLNLDDFPVVFPAAEATLTRLGHAEAVGPLLAACVKALLETSREHLLSCLADEALYRRAIRAAIEAQGVAGALLIYQQADPPERAAVVLDELARSGLRGGPAMDAARQRFKSWIEDEDHAVQATWLRAFLDAPSAP
jgi:hypothetical protein